MEGGRGGEERGENVFFPPLPSPSPILNPSTSPLKTLFDSSQLSGSINVQDGGTTLSWKQFMDLAPKYACFAGYNDPWKKYKAMGWIKWQLEIG